MITDSFNNYMREYFDAEIGAYTAATQTEIEKNTFNVKAVIRHMLEESLGKRNIPHAQNIGKQYIEFKICKKTIGVHEETKKIPCKYSKPDKDEMTIYFSTGIIEEFNMKPGDIWYVYFKTNDPAPWLGIISKSKWASLFDTLDVAENDTQNVSQKVQMAFKPRAQILLQLGEQLIKNESIAILELVKNAYDADAKKVTVTMIDIDVPESGYIEILDDGCGMDIDIIEKIWMEPGNSHKKDQVERGERTPGGRLPIGEKGIGRFGAHKLGKKIELISRMIGKKEVRLVIDWTAFSYNDYLTDVKILIEERDPIVFIGESSGTKIIIKQLSCSWNRGMLRNVKRAMTKLISPFDYNHAFEAMLATNYEDWLEGLLDFNKIKDYALFTGAFCIKGSRITNMDFDFKPYDNMIYVKAVHREETDILMTRNNHDIINLDDYQIGEIKLFLYVFDRDNQIISQFINDKKTFREYLNDNGGISVFRDNMRVLDYGEKGNDWLELDSKRINRPGEKISNNIVLGAVLLSREKSMSLKEKANREGFIEDAAYDCFKDAISFCIEYFTVYRNIEKDKLRNSLSGGKREPIVEDLSDVRVKVKEYLKNEREYKEIDTYLKRIETDYNYLKNMYLKTASAGMSYGIVIHEIEKIIKELSKVVEVEKSSIKITSLSKRLSRLIENYAELLRNKDKKKNKVIDIIEQALFSVEYRLDMHGIDINKKYDLKDITEIKCSENLVVGSIINIIDNSIWWLEHYRIEKKKLFIKISKEISGYISIVIADNGFGFTLTPEDMIKPFVGKKNGGMGLGLNVVNEIMISQGGKLHFPERGEFEIPDEYYNGAVIALAFKEE